jgi:hypothetical protein
VYEPEKLWHTMSASKYNSKFISRYLEYVENTEPPSIFHVWSALSCISACMGRRVYYELGFLRVYPNMYVTLVGQPATRKNVAINIAKDLIRGNTAVQFAPDDTSGQRQGLIAAMTGKSSKFSEQEQSLLDAIGDDMDMLQNFNINANVEDRNALFVTATEFNVFIGQNNMQLLNFLIKMYDAEEYIYRLKTEEIILNDGLLNILAGTTPTQIANAMPPEASGGGFMSRLILVFGDRKHKSLHKPPALNEKLQAELIETYTHCSYNMYGAMNESPEADAALAKLYEQDTEIQDVRFTHYKGRRHTHLIKISMAFAAARRSNTIELEDVQDAERLLRTTELYMPDALGEYGMSPLSAARQKLLEFLQSTREPVTGAVLWALMGREMKLMDFRQTMNDFVNSGKVDEVSIPVLGQAFIAKSAKQKVQEDEISSILDGL